MTKGDRIFDLYRVEEYKSTKVHFKILGRPGTSHVRVPGNIQYLMGSLKVRVIAWG